MISIAGFTREPSFGSEFDMCLPCFDLCQVLSNEACHPQSGVCQSCTNHTTGDYCQLCEPLYYQKGLFEVSLCLSTWQHLLFHDSIKSVGCRPCVHIRAAFRCHHFNCAVSREHVSCEKDSPSVYNSCWPNGQGN